jgi:hypothetical protein
MKKGIYITYKNGHTDIFENGDLESKTWTMMGHASEVISAWQTSKEIFKFDNYNAVCLSEVISIRYIN